jgi:2-keto-4-pentenoate hydratase/2-oxohepta-3-ene-1,7-dioic acid hydratase in catechol pathway
VSGDIFRSFEVTDQEVRMEEVALMVPITPRIVVGLGRNYYSHIKEMSVDPPNRPAIFFKPASSMIAHRQPVIIPQWATRVDYEGELGVVIGKKMKGVDEKDVPEYILGCTCFNDITERDVGSSGLINQDISKCCETFGPCGPWICTEVDPDNAELKTILDGKVVQQDNYANIVFSTRRILSELSQFMTLWPGDLVITGTPGGIGPLQAGDVVEVEITGVGRLSNPVQCDESDRQDYI